MLFIVGAKIFRLKLTGQKDDKNGIKLLVVKTSHSKRFQHEKYNDKNYNYFEKREILG